MSRTIGGEGYWFLDDSIVIPLSTILGSHHFSLDKATNELREIVEISEEVRATPRWNRECSSYDTPDARNYSSFSAFKQDALKWLNESRIQEASRRRKRILIAQRRSEFAEVRADVELELIERDGYICRKDGCHCTENLTIDHVIPLSKGGKDTLDNLRFLCRSHNSEKGDR